MPDAQDERIQENSQKQEEPRAKGRLLIFDCVAHLGSFIPSNPCPLREGVKLRHSDLSNYPSDLVVDTTERKALISSRTVPVPNTTAVNGSSAT